MKLSLRAYGLWLKKFPRLIVSIIISSITASITPYVWVYFSSIIINALIDGVTEREMLSLVLLTVGVSGTVMLINQYALKLYKVESRTDYYKFKSFFADKLIDMRYSVFESAETKALNEEIQSNDNFLGNGLRRIPGELPRLIKGAFTVIIGAALSLKLFTSNVSTKELLFLNSPMFIVLAVIILLAVSVIPAKLSSKAMSYWTKSSDDGNEGNRIFSQVFEAGLERKNAIDLRLYDQYDVLHSLITNNNPFGIRGRLYKYAKGPMGFYCFLSAFISGSLLIFLYSFIILKAIHGAFTIGEISRYIGAVTTLSGGITQLLISCAAIKANVPFLKLTFALLDKEEEKDKGTKTVKSFSDKLEFKNVSFKYDGRDDYALKGVNLTLEKNKRYAIVGENGSGKTTLIKLLLGFYEAESGEILLDGTCIDSYTKSSRRELFACVFQDFFLFPFTIIKNITNKKEPDEEKINSLLDSVAFNLDENKFTDGIHTAISTDYHDNGVNISGGEAQKLALARALYKDTPIVLLDEPTAALDPIAEATIYENFNGMVHDKTAIYISHRLSSCKFCDEIIVMDNGRIVEQGTHDELIESNKKYAELWNAQAQFYI